MTFDCALLTHLYASVPKRISLLVQYYSYAHPTSPHSMLWTRLLFLVLLLTSIHAFNWNRSVDAQWAFGCSFPGPSIGYKIVPGENCSGECFHHPGPKLCTHFTHTAATTNCTFLHMPKVKLDDAISALGEYDVCGVLGRTFAGRPSPRPNVEQVEELWLWLGPVLGALATIIGAVLTLLWARHETMKHRPPLPNHNPPDESMENYSAFDTYDPPLHGRRAGL